MLPREPWGLVCSVALQAIRTHHHVELRLNSTPCAGYISAVLFEYLLV